MLVVLTLSLLAGGCITLLGIILLSFRPQTAVIADRDDRAFDRAVFVGHERSPAPNLRIQVPSPPAMAPVSRNACTPRYRWID